MDWAASMLRCMPLASSKQHFWRKALATVGEALVSHADEKHTEATFQVMRLQHRSAVCEAWSTGCILQALTAVGDALASHARAAEEEARAKASSLMLTFL